MARTRSRLAVAVASVSALLAATLALTPAHAEDIAVSPPSGPNPTGIGNPFMEHNGMMWEYVRNPEGYEGFNYPATTYASITQKLESGWYTDRGIRDISIYGPYKSTNTYLGLPAIDFFDAQVGTGTIDDFRSMAQAAQARGITISSYLALLYVDRTNQLWVKGSSDKAAGIDSFEANLFRWDERSLPQSSCPSAPSGQNIAWTRSTSVAGNRCYVTSWGLPALDYAKPQAMQYAKSVLAFWMDLGVTGFTYDAPQSMLGMQDGDDSRQTELLIDYPTNYVYPDGRTRAHTFVAEGDGSIANMAKEDRLGYTEIATLIDDDSNSIATKAARSPQTVTVDQLEDYFATWMDSRRANGRTSWTSALFDTSDTSLPPALRALDAAVLAGGAGMRYFNHQQTLNADLSAAAGAQFYDVFRAIDRSPALAPGASRLRIPTQTDSRAYALLRRSMDGSKTVLAVYNFSGAAKCVSVNLAGSGVALDQQAVDVATGLPSTWIRSAETTVKLPAYGYRFLEVQAGAGFPWRVIDSSASGWTTGGGWTQTTDASAFGGSRIAGNAVNAYAQYTFTGSSVQGWGRKSTTGGNQVRVYIDGVQQSEHSQRRTAPISGSGGTAFYGQQLFSISGLSAGTHTIRLEQINSTSGSNAGGTGIDYLRVSDESYVAPAALSGSDRCAGDTTAPVSVASVAPETGGGQYGDPAIVTITASDNSSGVDAIQYRTAGSTAWTDYVAPIQVSGAGTHVIEYRSTDVAGNVESVHQLSVDIAAPAEPAHISPTVSASIRCMAGKGTVYVSVTNPDAATIGFTLASDYGSTSFAGIASGKSAVHSFTTRLVSVPAGTVTVDASAVIDGEPVTAHVTAAYAASTCG